MILSEIKNPVGRDHTFETEREGHGDMILVRAANEIVFKCAEATLALGVDLRTLRTDFNLNYGAIPLDPDKPDGHWRGIGHLVGQATLDRRVDLAGIARETLLNAFERNGHFKDPYLDPDRVELITTVAPQSPQIANAIANEVPCWGDSATGLGVSIGDLYGEEEGFRELVLGKRVDSALREVQGTRPDGKLFVHSRWTREGVDVQKVNITTSHEGDVTDDFFEITSDRISAKIQEWGGYGNPRVLVNVPGGRWTYDSFRADSFSSKKDHPIHSGGVLANGGDGRSGKCGWKAATILAIGTRYLANIVRGSLDAHIVTIRGVSTFGSNGDPDQVIFRLEDIDPTLEPLREAINIQLEYFPHDPVGLSLLAGVDWATLAAYDAYHNSDDDGGFYGPARPWNQVSDDLLFDFRTKIISAEV